MSKYLDREILDEMHECLERSGDLDTYELGCWKVSLTSLPIYKELGDYYYLGFIANARETRVTAIMLILAAEDEFADYPMIAE